MHPVDALRRLPNIFLLALLLIGCQREDASIIGTFRVGERVQAGPLAYDVIESHWKAELPGSRTPQNRYLLVRVSITNMGDESVSVPGFTLKSGDETYPEVTEGVKDVPDWLGILRTVQPRQTEAGNVVFDAPLSASKLVVSDAGEVGAEKYAYIDIPVQLE